MSNTAGDSKRKNVWYPKIIDARLEHHAYRLSRDGDQKITVTDLIVLALRNLVEELDKEEDS